LAAALEDAHARFDELAAIVANHHVEVVLKKSGLLDVALVNGKVFEHYKALEATASRNESSGKSSTASSDARAGAAADEAAQLLVSADYYVLNSAITPRQTVERYRIECDLPVGDDKVDVEIRVVDDQSRETYLATWSEFAWGRMTLSEVVLRCFCCALFGAPELPEAAGSYPDQFDEVALVIHERSAFITSEPLLLLSARRRYGKWALFWSRAYVEDGAQAWMPKPSELESHPLQLIWHVASLLDAPPGDTTQDHEESV